MECVLNLWQHIKQRDLTAQSLHRRQVWINQAKAKAAGAPRLAIVTGGNTGLGYETAKALVEAGYRTIIDAGIMDVPFGLTKDGFEMQFGV
ncbi:hypothetical protein BGZ94_001855, partial [Podila epigama]